MLEFYWGCLIGGILFAFVTVILGDLIGDLLDGMLDFLKIDGPDFLEPMVIIGAITSWGGAGVLLSEYTSLEALTVAILSLISAFILSSLVFFFYVKPMQNAENSTSFSFQDFAGKVAEVSVTIPTVGYGEVLVKMGAGNTNQIAASFDGEEIQSGSRVIVIEAKDDTLYVSRYEDMD